VGSRDAFQSCSDAWTFARAHRLTRLASTNKSKTLTPPVDTAAFDDHVPSSDVTLLVSVKSPCATTAVEERSADTAKVNSDNIVKEGNVIGDCC
jgi:hypothetical protein